jgi:glycine oxidase
VDITIVGAGVVGCAIAHELASRGANVRVLDRRGVGQGATRASAGVLAPNIEGHFPPLLRLGLCSLELYDAFIRRVRADSRESFEYERCGTVQVACDDREAEDLRRTAERLAAKQIPHTVFDGAMTRQIEPALAERITTALLIPSHGYVAAGSLTARLRVAAQERGASFSMTDVHRLDCGATRLRIGTAEGPVDTDVVIIAAGSWSGQLSMPAPPPVRPIRGQLLHLGFTHRFASHVIWGSQCYIVPWQDGSLLLGATVEDVGFNEDATVEGVRHLLDQGCRLFPQLATARFREVRVGLRPVTPDELPVIGPSSTMPGVFYATGHYRNGVLLAPLTAKLLADLILDDRKGAELELVRPDRFGL